jgi:hypothetical protein
MNEGLAVQQDSGLMNFEEYAMSVDSVVRQIALIQEVQKKVMRQGEHFGVIPGCGDKPTLLKPGAEKLGFTFRLRPEFDVNTVDWSNGHREYQVKCKLYHIPTGNAVGEGVGTCTTMEGKFRYRWDNTGKPIPKEYWDTKNVDCLGGPFNAPRKVNGQWFIFQKVEHDNPADYYNTCEKMAKKRAHVDAILTATAASDIFTQDIEDMTEVIPQAETKTETNKKEPPKQPQAKSATEKDLRQEILNMVHNMVEEDLIDQYLIEKTAWDGKNKDGEVKHFEGKSDLTQISDAAIKVVYGKIKKDYEIWQKGQSNA